MNMTTERDDVTDTVIATMHIALGTLQDARNVWNHNHPMLILNKSEKLQFLSAPDFWDTLKYNLRIELRFTPGPI